MDQIPNYGSPHMTMNYYPYHNYRIQPPSSRYKGVTSHYYNGFSWEAYIFVNNHRISLGNFETETDAAMAVDSASIKLEDAHRNFPWTENTIHEPKFQSSFNLETVVVMIRNGSYVIAFLEFLDKMRAANKVGIMDMVQELFHKVLTPTDVSNNGRLVIPKKFATLYFPICHNTTENADARLCFYDSSMKSTWEFKYCYCKGNKSYAFTRGWYRFVRAMDLKANDVVVFSAIQNRHVMIGVKYNHATRNNVIVEDGARSGIQVMKVEDNSYQNNEIVGSSREQNVHMGRVKEENEIVANESNIVKEKRLKIFGVVIEIED